MDWGKGFGRVRDLLPSLLFQGTPPSQHRAVLPTLVSGSFFFGFPGSHSIRASFDDCVAHSSGSMSRVPCFLSTVMCLFSRLGTMHRDRWAAARSHLLSLSPDNVESLAVVESALFHITLHEAEEDVATTTATTSFFHALMGDGQHVWYVPWWCIPLSRFHALAT
jgi:hypothetical protein